MAAENTMSFQESLTFATLDSSAADVIEKYGPDKIPSKVGDRGLSDKEATRQPVLKGKASEEDSTPRSKRNVSILDIVYDNEPMSEGEPVAAAESARSSVTSDSVREEAYVPAPTATANNQQEAGLPADGSRRHITEQNLELFLKFLCQAFTSLQGQMEQVKDQMEQVKDQMEQVKDQLEQVKDQMEQVKDQMEQVKDQIEQAMEQVEDQMEQVKDQMEQVKDQIEQAMEQVKDQMEQVKQLLFDYLEFVKPE